MVMFAESDYTPEEHARVMEAAWGKPPEGEVNLVEGVDDEAVVLDALPPKEEQK